MAPFDPDDLIVVIDNKTGKVIGRASDRTRKRMARAEQMDEENERARERREKFQLKKELAAEADRSQLADNDNQFVFGPSEDFVEPTYTGDDVLDAENYEASRVKFLLRKIEYCLGHNYSPAWQRGELSLADLEAKYRAMMEGNSTPPLPVARKDKGKGRAAVDSDEGRPSNYDGITFSRKAPADIDSSDDDSSHIHKSESQSLSRNKPAPAAARSAFSPLTSTDSSTLIGGKMLHYSQNLPPDARIHVPPTCATVPDLPPPRKKSRHVPPTSSKPTSTQPRRPSGSLKISSFGPASPHVTEQGNPPQARDGGRVPPVPMPPSQNLKCRGERNPPPGSQSESRPGDPPARRPSQKTAVGYGGVVANSSNRSRAGGTVTDHAKVSANTSGNRAPQPRNDKPAGSGGRNPRASAGQVDNAHSSRNPRDRARQAANARPEARSPTPPEVDAEIRAAMAEDSDVEAPVNTQGTPTDPRVAILHGSKAILASFAPSTHPTLRFMRRRAKAQVISVGSYNWEPTDPGDQVPTVEQIVAQAFALASRRMHTNYPFLMEHVLLVEIVVRTERSNIKRALEPVVVRFFTFSDNVAENRTKSRNLLPHAFHQLRTANGVVPFGSTYIREACRVAVFSDKSSFGIQYPTYFNPLCWRFLAFIAAITNHIIHSWRDGRYKRENLDVTQQLPVFRRYLKLLEDMSEHQPIRLEELCAAIHDEARAQHEQTLEKSPEPEPPVQWAPDKGERYVPRFVHDHAASEGSAEDEQIPADDGDGINAADRDDERADGPGPSRGWGTAAFESQTSGAGPSRHQYRQRDDSDSSDIGLPAPGQVLSGRGAMDRTEGWGQEDPPDAEAAEYPDEQERDVGEEVN